jgi:hypothetical protein
MYSTGMVDPLTMHWKRYHKSKCPMLHKRGQNRGKGECSSHRQKREEEAHLSASRFNVGAHSFKQPQGAGGHHIRSVVRILERHTHMGLRAQIVDLIRADGVHPLA